MDPKSLEQEGREKPKEKEILPEHIALPLARALEQEFDLPIIKMRMLLEVLNSEGQTEGEKTRIEALRAGVERVAKFIENLKYSEEIEIVDDNNGWDFKFPENTQPSKENIKPQEGTITVNEDLTKKIMAVLNHNLNNALFTIEGNSELLSMSQNQDLKQQMATINEISSRRVKNSLISTKFGGGETHKLQLVTDANGNTTPVPILRTPE